MKANKEMIREERRLFKIETDTRINIDWRKKKENDKRNNASTIQR